MKVLSRIFQLLLVSQFFISCSLALHPAIVQASKTSAIPRQNTRVQLRAFSTELSTCGYEDGSPTKVRTANDGFNCRINTRNGLWGFCTNTAIAVTDCRMAGRCVDTHGCSDGCGFLDEDLFTTTCNSLYCSVDILTFGVDQTYSHIACGASPVTKHFYITPTVETTSISSSSEIDETTLTQISTTSLGATAESTNTPDDSSQDQDKSSDGDSSPPIGPIVGGVIGGLVLICGTIVAVVFLRRKGRDKKPPAPDMSQPKPPDELGQSRALYGRENAVELGS